MTAFTSKQETIDNMSFVFQCSSVNKKGLDVHISCPGFLRNYELDFKKILQKYLKRGRVSFIINLENEHDFLDLDEGSFQQMKKKFKEINNEEIFLKDMLNLPNFCQQILDCDKKIIKSLLNYLEGFFQEFVKNRRLEGNEIKKELFNYGQNLENNCQLIREKQINNKGKVEQKIKEQIKKLELDINLERFDQEVFFLIQKTSIEEELVRLSSHFKHFFELLEREGVVGRELDFLMQEMNREYNTIASKTSDYASKRLVIESKTILDDLREQIQNIE